MPFAPLVAYRLKTKIGSYCMKVSRYNFHVPSPKEAGVHFLYNSLHDNRIVLQDGDVTVDTLFSKIKEHRPLNPKESLVAKDLKEMGYIVDEDVDEKRVFRQWLNQRVTNQNEILTVTILTTLACNLRCTYCYEKEKLGKSRMSPEILQQCVDWIKTRIRTMNPRKVNIIFFGGEPLINMEAIRNFSKEVYPFCLENKVEYSAGMATNGIFLTPKISDELKDYGFDWIKITFDGDRCEHDKKRIYKGGRGTFDKIFSNLEDISGKLKILLGGNFDKENVESFHSLVERISKSKFKNDIIATNFKPIMPEMVEAKGELKGIASSCVHCTFQDFEIRKMMELRETTRKFDLHPTDPINTGPCEYYRRNAVTIGIDGKLYKCIAFLGINGTEIGDTAHQEFNETGEAMLNATAEHEHPMCEDCSFNPICAGGCRADAYNTTGDFKEISCQRHYFNKTLTEELPKEYYDAAEWAEQMGGV